MPEKDANNWTLAIWIASNQSWLVAGLIAFAMNLLHSLYLDAKLNGKAFAEASMCLIFVSVSRPLFEPLPWVNDDGALVVGAMAGVAGAKIIIPSIERVARRFGGRSK